MISHTFIGVNNFEHALRLYVAFMADLGHILRFKNLERPWAGWMAKDAARPLFLIGRPFDGGVAQSGNGQMVALLASDRKSVDAAYTSALANGATCEGSPGRRPHYHPDYYGAYFYDPDGNKIGLCYHGSVVG
jgi:catechol 2,3-dioxygenase-like lactoylglutathione lyase family enzyme